MDFNRFEYPIKLNVHLPVRAKLFHLAVGLNNELRSLAASEVDFAPQSIHIPHISLFMGRVNTAEHRLAFFDVIRNLAAQQMMFTVEARRLSLAPPDKKGNIYVFVDIEPESIIKDIKKNLVAVLSPFVKGPEWEYVDEVPHITIGYVANSSADALASYVRMKKFRSETGNAEAFEISRVGPRGTCLGTIRTFEFENS